MKLKYVLLIFAITGVVVSCKKLPKKTSDEDKIIINESDKLDETITAAVPHVYITTEGSVMPVEDKELEVNGSIWVVSNGYKGYADLDHKDMVIKGRGHNSWKEYPKKPYSVKLDKKASIFGLEASKSWVLVANYLDYTLMMNAVAFKAAKQLGMPYINTAIPVDLTVNGDYKGAYLFTEKININPGRVDIDENGGVLFEIDSYFDNGDAQFKSAGYNLPVQVKDPDISSPSELTTIKNEFEAFEAKVKASTFPNNDYADYFDKQQLVNFLIVNNLCGNSEISHPKSTYMFKAPGGKYTMGPVWDFDWGFGFNEVSSKYFNDIELPVIKANDTAPGATFFRRLMSDPEVKQLLKTTWKNFKDNRFEELMSYIEEYAATVRESKARDYELWNVGYANYGQIKKDLKTYLRLRAAFMDNYMKSF